MELLNDFLWHKFKRNTDCGRGPFDGVDQVRKDKSFSEFKVRVLLRPKALPEGS